MKNTDETHMLKCFLLGYVNSVQVWNGAVPGTFVHTRYRQGQYVCHIKDIIGGFLIYRGRAVIRRQKTYRGCLTWIKRNKNRIMSMPHSGRTR